MNLNGMVFLLQPCFDASVPENHRIWTCKSHDVSSRAINQLIVRFCKSMCVLTRRSMMYSCTSPYRRQQVMFPWQQVVAMKTTSVRSKFKLCCPVSSIRLTLVSYTKWEFLHVPCFMLSITYKFICACLTAFGSSCLDMYTGVKWVQMVIHDKTALHV